MRIFRTINLTLGRLDKMTTGERKMAIDSLIAINERMADYVINLLNEQDNVRDSKKIYS